MKEEKHLLTLLIWALQVAKLNDAERELSEISERLKATSKGKAMSNSYVVYCARCWATLVNKIYHTGYGTL